MRQILKYWSVSGDCTKCNMKILILFGINYVSRNEVFGANIVFYVYDQANSK